MCTECMALHVMCGLDHIWGLFTEHKSNNSWILRTKKSIHDNELLSKIILICSALID